MEQSVVNVFSRTKVHICCIFCLILIACFISLLFIIQQLKYLYKEIIQLRIILGIFLIYQVAIQ